MYKKILFQLDSKGFIHEGYFMEWGLNVTEYSVPPVSYSVAIVKLKDGTIKLIYPTDIKFVEP